MARDFYRQLIDELVLIMKSNPEGTERDHREACRPLVHASRDFVDTLFDNWFGANYQRLKLVYEKDAVTVTYQQRQERGRKMKHTQAAARTRAAVAMDILFQRALTMTFGECSQAGGKFARLAKYGKPAEVVGKKLTEQQVRNIWGRNR